MGSTSNVNGTQGQDPWSDYGVGDTQSDLDTGDTGSENGNTGGVGGDQYVGPEGGQDGTPLPVKETLAHLRDLLTHIRSDASLDAKTKSDLITKINKLIPKLQTLLNQHADTVPGDIAQQVNDVDLAASPADPTGASDGTDGGDPTTSLASELKTYEDSLKKNSNLSDADKKKYTDQVEKWISNLGLNKDQTLVDTITQDFETMKQEVTDLTNYSPAASSLAQILGKTPADIEAAFKKHGIDPKNLPNPPDAKIAELLNDPEFAGDQLNSLKEGVATGYKDLKDEIDKQTKAANDLNAANVASDTSNQDNLDVSSFKFLQDATDHKDDKSKALQDARKKLGDETATILSAMYGKEVTASSDPAKAGMISFDGSDLNVCTSSASGDVQFGTSGIDWPSVTLVTYEVDAEGDGQTPIPSWMTDAKYPTHAYDS